MSGMELTAFTFSGLAVGLTLLVAFTCEAPMISRGVGPDLPRVSHPNSMWHAQREDALVVGILRNGDVFFGSDRLNPDRLGRAIRESLPSNRKVYIRADARVRWGQVALVIDQVRAAGIPSLAFFAEQRRTAAGSH